jgi:hypothetical protein
MTERKRRPRQLSLDEIKALSVKELQSACLEGKVSYMTCLAELSRRREIRTEKHTAARRG